MPKDLVKYTDEFFMSKIHVICGQKVMMDRDLGEIFDVETRALNLAV